MSAAILEQLVVIVVVVAVGWVAGRTRVLGDGAPNVLSNAAFFVFVPALLFRTTARLDFSRLEAATLASYFVPVIALGLVVYAVEAARRRRALRGAASDSAPVATASRPATRGLATTFGNSVQIGIPLALALFGEAGLAIHLTIVSLHGLVLLTLFTLLVELDLARARRRAAPDERRSLARTLLQTVRATVIHPVILPILAGIVWNFAGAPIPGVVDRTLALLGLAVVPLCLVLIGISLAAYGFKGSLRGALVVSTLKLVVQPLLVYAFGRFALGLGGVPLAVVTVAASLPVGSNPLLFAQRYRAMEAETTSTIVLSTLAFVATLPLWIALVGTA